jgi:hypothetical protein
MKPHVVVVVVVADSQTIWYTDIGRHSNTELHTTDQHEQSGKCAIVRY